MTLALWFVVALVLALVAGVVSAVLDRTNIVKVSWDEMAWAVVGCVLWPAGVVALTFYLGWLFTDWAAERSPR